MSSSANFFAAQRLRWNVFGLVTWWLATRSDLWVTTSRLSSAMFGWKHTHWDVYVARIGYILFAFNIVQALYFMASNTSQEPMQGSGAAQVLPASQVFVRQQAQATHPAFPSSLSISSIRERAQRNQASSTGRAEGGGVEDKATPTGKFTTSPTMEGLPLSSLLTPAKSTSELRSRHMAALHGEAEQFHLQTPPAWNGSRSRREREQGIARDVIPGLPGSQSITTLQSTPQEGGELGSKILTAHEAHNTGLDPLSVSVYKARKSLMIGEL